MTTTKSATTRCTIPSTSNLATTPAKPATPAPPVAPAPAGWTAKSPSQSSGGFSSASSFSSAPRTSSSNPLLAPLPPPGSSSITLVPPPPGKPTALLPEKSAAPATPVDRSQLGLVDRKLVDAMMLDGMAPGETRSVTVAASGDVAAVLGVEVGAEVTVEIERDADEPSKFGFKLGGAGELSGLLGADTAGQEGHGTVGGFVEGGVGIEVDLSKPGEATALAGFAAQAGLTAMFPPAGQALVLAQKVSGVSLPGEPMSFMRDHLSEIEVAAGGKFGAEAAVALFGSASGEVEAALKGGGKLERVDEGWKISASIGSSAELTLKGGAGAGGGSAEVTLGKGAAAVTFTRDLLVKSGPPTTFEDAYKAEIELEAAANLNGSTAVGGKATVSVEIDELPPLFKERVKASLAVGDVAGAKALLQQALQSGQVKGQLSVSGTATVEGEAGLNLKAGGTGGQGKLEGGISTEVPIGSVECTVDWQGVKLSGELGKLEGAVSWDRLRSELPAAAE